MSRKKCYVQGKENYVQGKNVMFKGGTLRQGGGWGEERYVQGKKEAARGRLSGSNKIIWKMDGDFWLVKMSMDILIMIGPESHRHIGYWSWLAGRNKHVPSFKTETRFSTFQTKPIEIGVIVFGKVNVCSSRMKRTISCPISLSLYEQSLAKLSGMF